MTLLGAAGRMISRIRFRKKDHPIRKDIIRGRLVRSDILRWMEVDINTLIIYAMTSTAKLSSEPVTQQTKARHYDTTSLKQELPHSCDCNREELRSAALSALGAARLREQYRAPGAGRVRRPARDRRGRLGSVLPPALVVDVSSSATV